MLAAIGIAVLAGVALVTVVELLLDRPGRAPSVRGALVRTGLWVAAALGTGLAFHLTAPAAQADRIAREFLAAWLLEFSLSLDNLFVLALIVSVLRVPEGAVRRVLLAGLPAAIAARCGLIAGGMALLVLAPWLKYLLGTLLILSALRMVVAREPDTDPSRNLVVAAARRFYPVSAGYDGRRFMTRVEGRRAATPLLVALIMVESTEALLAMDSVPAIFTVTREPFLAMAASALALAALRSLFFALRGLESRTRLVKLALALLLVYLSVTMFLSHHHPMPVEVTLAVLALLLGGSAAGTVLFEHRLKVRRPGEQEPREPVLGQDVDRLARAALQRARKLVALVAGLTVLGLSIPIGLLPGPGGTVVFVIGLAILASEFIWARRLVARAKSLALQADSALASRPRPWLIPLVLGVTIGGVALVVWLLPLPPRVVIFAAIWPVVLECVWAWRTIRRWRQARQGGSGGPGTDGR